MKALACRGSSRFLNRAVAIFGTRTVGSNAFVWVTTAAVVVVSMVLPLGASSFVPCSHRLSSFDSSLHSKPRTPIVVSQQQQQQQSSPRRGRFLLNQSSRSKATTTTNRKMSSSSESSEQQQEEDSTENDDDQKFQKLFKWRNKQWVVLVDDEESIRFSVGDFLYNMGYEVTACADANSLLDRILLKNKDDENNENVNNRGDDERDTKSDYHKNNHGSSNKNQQQQHHRLPDVIISDVRMPESDKNGYELVAFLRSASDTNTEASSSLNQRTSLLNQRSLLSLRNVPIVLLTAKAMTEDRIMGYRAGADVVLPKPFAPEELVSIIDNLIRRKHQRLFQPKIVVNSNRRSSYQSLSSSSISQEATKAVVGLPSVPPQQHPPAASLTETATIQEDYRFLKKELDEIKAIVQQNAASTVQKTNIVLTKKERTVLELLSEGYTPLEIAFEMKPPPPPSRNNSSDDNYNAAKPVAEKEEVATIRKTIEGLIEKSETDSKTELIRWARRVGYVVS